MKVSTYKRSVHACSRIKGWKNTDGELLVEASEEQPTFEQGEYTLTPFIHL